ncbi:MAG: hypothetical protein H6P95_1325 [Candidatus Aminicenantes bacterium]|jgi:hypothetical protein|nr:hypothetical protein [Candidatus Aminicenantes bacterium]
MAKTLVVLLLIAGAGYFIYQRTNATPSEEEQLVSHLQERFVAALNKFTSAAGRSGMIGLDSTYDIDSVINQIKQIRTELAALRGKLTEAKAVRKADALSERIENFFKKNEILGP